MGEFGFAVIDLGSLHDGGRMQQLEGPLAGLDLAQIDDCAITDVPLNSIFTTLQSYLGTNYVNDFNFLGRTFQVNLRSYGAYRNLGHGNYKDFAPTEHHPDLRNVPTLACSLLRRYSREFDPRTADKFTRALAADGKCHHFVFANTSRPTSKDVSPVMPRAD